MIATCTTQKYILSKNTIIFCIYIDTIINLEGIYNFTAFNSNPKYYSISLSLLSQFWLIISMKSPDIKFNQCNSTFITKNQRIMRNQFSCNALLCSVYLKIVICLFSYLSPMFLIFSIFFFSIYIHNTSYFKYFLANHFYLFHFKFNFF